MKEKRYLENEIRWVKEGTEAEEVHAWRVSHGDIDPPEYADVWNKLKEKLEADGSSKKACSLFSSIYFFPLIFLELFFFFF